MESYGAIAVELSVGLFGLILLTKMMGRASMSEATPFDFISLIVVGDFVSEAIYDPRTSIGKVMFAIFFWGALIVLIDQVTLKFSRSRTFFESRPEMVIRSGKIDRAILKKNRLDIDHLQMLLRNRDIFSVREVDYAILEPNGKLSVIRQPDYEWPKRRDLSLKHAATAPPLTLISDGHVIEDNLHQAEKTRAWLNAELCARAIPDEKSVFLAEWRQEDGLFVQLK
ncbi:MAG: DUF421 domain-containing protein [Sporolactobacillus sp.]